MTRSKLRKLKRLAARSHSKTVMRALPIASAVLACMPSAHAQEQQSVALEEIVVTAQKRTEDLQSVPISVTAINSAKIEELHINDFNDYVKYLPSVTSQTTAPGFSRVLIRGISSDNNTNHSGPLPTVGTYLDEQPITTIQGALDLHLYDISRVEALAGPQGTLYGASSEAGTVRIITNKPDPTKFSAGYEIEGSHIAHSDMSGLAQGYVNIPLASNAAIRLVAWGEHKAGYLDNIPATRTFPQFGITIDNSAVAKNNFNDVTTYGARAALKVDLNDSWSITPMVMAQETRANGFFGYNPSIGDLALTHFSDDTSDDHFVDSSLTVEGKIGNFSLTYAGSFLKRNDITHTDYSDYSLAYDISIPSYTAPIVDANGNHINPTQNIHGKDRYTKQSHELRLASPEDWPVTFIAGLFYQRQQHGIEQNYVIEDLGPQDSVTGWPGTWWLTEQVRTDRDSAAFSEITWHATDHLSVLAGARYFKYDNSLGGFRGFGLTNPLGAVSDLGEISCVSPQPYHGAPCLSFDKDTSGHGITPKGTITWKFDDRRLIYATYSKGYRPGGINRVGNLPPYQADFLKNYEIGWKTTWFDNRVRFNGAFFWEDWDNFQFSFLGANSLTRIANAGAARVKGIETEVAWAITEGLTLSGGLTVIDPKLTENYCAAIGPDGSPITQCTTTKDPTTGAVLQAPAGTQLPSTSKVKGNVVARYQFPLGGYDVFGQAAYVFQSGQWDDLRIAEREALGHQPGYGSIDLSTGFSKDSYTLNFFVENLTDKRGQIYRFNQCGSCSIVANYVLPIQPRTIGVKFGQKF